MRVVAIPADTPVEYSHANVPRETPFGIMDSAVLQVRFDGLTYNLLDEPTGEQVAAIDVESGETVTLDFRAVIPRS